MRSIFAWQRHDPARLPMPAAERFRVALPKSSVSLGKTRELTAILFSSDETVQRTHETAEEIEAFPRYAVNVGRREILPAFDERLLAVRQSVPLLLDGPQLRAATRPPRYDQFASV